MEDLALITIIVGVAHSGLRLATPYLYAALGEMLGQRAGVLNLGVCLLYTSPSPRDS